MSVINQMLKDLDKRQAEDVASEGGAVVNPVQSSSRNILLVALVVIVILNIAGIWAWGIYQENQQLHTSNEKYKTNQQALKLDKSVDKVYSAKQASSKINALTSEVNENENDNVTSNPADIDSSANAITQKAKVDGSQQKKITEKISKVKAVALIEKTPSNLIQETKDNQSPAPAQLSISRVQLSPEALVQQKLSQAEQAIDNNLISKAEELFSDILLIMPEQHNARKKLAALWFGRQSNQAALNLLSKGIALSPQDSEYRLMKARIYLNLGQHKKAVNTLLVLSSYKNTEYQSLLASTAQQISLYPIAITAYGHLTDLESSTGRWWLGLAVAYDSSSQFLLAIESYQKALVTGNLSGSAEEFVRGRLQELGE